MHFSANESIARQHIAELEAEAEKRRLVRSGRSHRRLDTKPRLAHRPATR